MRRHVPALGLLVLLTVIALPASAMAAKPSNNCPAASSGWVQVDGEGWWAATVAGIIKEGLTVESEAERFGFGDDVEAFKQWVIAGVFSLDRNGNGFICMQDLPNTPGLPAFLLNAVDDSASTPNHA